jgi:outer membrane lipopolysaccharide assembly protein LptE/RlpB
LVTPLIIVGCRFQLESSKVIDEKLGIVEVALSKMQNKKTRVEERCLWEMLMQVTSPKKNNYPLFTLCHMTIAESIVVFLRQPSLWAETTQAP